MLRAKPPSPYYPTPASAIVSSPSQPRPLARIFNPFVNLISRLRCWIFGKIDWWRPLNFGWFGCLHDYGECDTLVTVRTYILKSTSLRIPSTPYHPRRTHHPPLHPTPRSKLSHSYRASRTTLPIRDILPHLQAQHSIPEKCTPATRLLTRGRKVRLTPAISLVTFSVTKLFVTFLFPQRTNDFITHHTRSNKSLVFPPRDRSPSTSHTPCQTTHPFPKT